MFANTRTVQQRCQAILSVLQGHQSEAILKHGDALRECEAIMSIFTSAWEHEIDITHRQYLLEHFLPQLFRLLINHYAYKPSPTYSKIARTCVCSLINGAVKHHVHYPDFAAKVLSQCVYAEVPFFAKRHLVCAHLFLVALE